MNVDRHYVCVTVTSASLPGAAGSSRHIESGGPGPPWPLRGVTGQEDTYCASARGWSKALPPPPAPLDRVVTSHHQTGPLSSERLSVGLWSSVSPLVRRHPRSSQSNYKEVTGACTCNTYLATGLILWHSLEPCPTSYRPDLCSPF